MKEDNTGILLKARNGTIIAYDETGLRLRLSDEVLTDIAARLGTAQGEARVPADVLGDIDAWSVERIGDFYAFDAKLPAYPVTRRFRRHVRGEGIFAEPPGRLLGLFGLGGQRAASFHDIARRYPAHIVTSDDDIGAVGMGGIGRAPATPRLAPVRHTTLMVAAADALVGLLEADARALPLCYVRTETDSSGAAQDLAGGVAMDNLGNSIANLVAAAHSLGVRPDAPVVCLDFSDDDTTSTQQDYVDGMLRVMDSVTSLYTQHGLDRPTFLIWASESGRRVQEHWTLSLFSKDHRIVLIGPGTAFDWTLRARLTPVGMADLAHLTALVIRALLSGEVWACPRLLHAEQSGPDTVHVTCDAMGPLMLDDGAHGFTITTGDGSVPIFGCRITEDDPMALMLSVPDLPTQATLHYGVGHRGGLRDGFAASAPSGDTLHRWALPASLEIR